MSLSPRAGTRSSMQNAATRWWPSRCPRRKTEATMADDGIAWSREEFERRLRAVGETAYHDKHPFHLMMHRGDLNRRQLQAWIENRSYYQAIIRSRTPPSSAGRRIAPS